MRKKIILGTIGLIVLLFLIIVFPHAGSWLIREDQLQKSDAVVMLMGSISDRIMQVADVYNKAYADRFILVEENMSGIEFLRKRGATLISNSEQVRNIATELGIPKDRIVLLPGNATSTQMEALIIGEYIKQNPEMDTLIIVSSPSHTRRAGMVFQKVLRNINPDICIYISPSKYNRFTGKSWWENREDIQIVLSEYIKIIAFTLIDRWKI